MQRSLEVGRQLSDRNLRLAGLHHFMETSVILENMIGVPTRCGRKRRISNDVRIQKLDDSPHPCGRMRLNELQVVGPVGFFHSSPVRGPPAAARR